jgi:galactonate dehydratase
MKIIDIQPLLVDRYLFVKVATDEGICGYGESGSWGFLEASLQAIETFKRYLVGQDPMRIEHHWQYMYRWSHFRGAAIMGALSALDIALWDIAGKRLGVPCYQLLGGKCRDRLRTYCHVFGVTVDQLVDGCIEAKKRGFTAIGHLTPFLDEPRNVPYFKTHAAKMRDAIETIGRYREAVGNDVDLCVEIHRQLTPAEAVVLGRGIESFHPMFYEDPTLPDNLDAMAQIAEKIHIPIATGERLHTIYEFEMLLKRGAVQYVRPDVCLCGGLTHAKKIAAIAEAHYVQVVPHNPLGPISTAACAQLAACIPNFAILEYPSWDWRPTETIPKELERRPKSGRLSEMERPKPDRMLVKTPLRVEDGFLIVPDAPGIGVELSEDAMQACPYIPREVCTRLHRDGSIVDQ